jgi:hypothetical protein
VKNQIRFFSVGKSPSGFVSLQDLRKSSGNIEKFDQELVNSWRLTGEDCEGDPNKRWIKFQNTFMTTDDLKWYKPVFQTTFHEIMESLIEDNVQYLEANVPLGSMYDLHRKYSEEEQVSEFSRLNQEFVSKHPRDFFGIKIRHESYRFFDSKEARKHMMLSIELQKKFKDFIIGFDLVGQEDHLNSYDAKHYIKDSLEIIDIAKSQGIDFKFYLVMKKILKEYSMEGECLAW